MTERAGSWEATISIRLEDPELREWLARALGPEATREVPRVRTTVRRAADGSVEVEMAARDAGAVRAGLNTYLGWIHLSLATSRAARARVASSA